MTSDAGPGGVSGDDRSSMTIAQPLQPASDGGIVAFGRIGSGGAPLVAGVCCSAGHFTDPHLEACPACGELLDPNGAVVERPRPPAGLLVFADGLTQLVECTIVIGREPVHDLRVAGGMALGLEIDDRALMLSRVHAELFLDGWDVLLIDRDSVNGTSIREPGGAWRRLAAEIPEVLTPGTEIRFGALEATFSLVSRP